MSKEYEFELLKDVRVPSNLVSVVGKEILEKGKFVTSVIKIVDYLKSIGHKINDIRDLMDDGIDNDSKPTFTESIKKAVKSGKKEIKETIEKVEEIVEDVVEEAQEIKEDIEEVIDDVIDLKEELTAYLDKAIKDFQKKVITPLEKQLNTKVDAATVKKDYIDSLNKKLNKANTDLLNNTNLIAILESRVTELEKAPEEVLETAVEVAEIAVVVEEPVPEEVIEIPEVPEETPSLKEQAEEIDLEEVDQEKFDQIKELSEKGLE